MNSYILIQENPIIILIRFLRNFQKVCKKVVPNRQKHNRKFIVERKYTVFRRLRRSRLVKILTVIFAKNHISRKSKKTLSGTNYQDLVTSTRFSAIRQEEQIETFSTFLCQQITLRFTYVFWKAFAFKEILLLVFPTFNFFQGAIPSSSI